MITKMHPENGEAAVTVVRKKSNYNKTIDYCDYKHPAITAIIPCWKGKDGKLISVATGKTVTIGENDDVRICLVGTTFKYPDGEEILLTRNWKREIYFITPERKPESFYNAFGE